VAFKANGKLNMHYPNKYFSAQFSELFDKDVACYSDIIFLKDIGPYKAGDRFPSGYISVDLRRNKLRIEMNTELHPMGACAFSYEIDLFALT